MDTIHPSVDGVRGKQHNKVLVILLVWFNPVSFHGKLLFYWMIPVYHGSS